MTRTNEATDALRLTPADLAGRVGKTLAGYVSVAVRGQLRKPVRSHAGHVYFTLTDGSASFRCVLSRGYARQGPQELTDGGLYVVTGTVALHVPTGCLQLVATSLMSWDGS